MNTSRFPAQEGPILDNELPARALEGVRTRRMLAILFDFVILMTLTGLTLFVLGLLGFLTFGLTWFLAAGILAIFPLIALVYNAITISGWRRATPGMHLMDLEVRLTNGEPVPFLNAAVHAVLFYLTWYIFFPLILVALVAHNKRCLHDMFSDMVVVRRRTESRGCARLQPRLPKRRSCGRFQRTFHRIWTPVRA